MIWLDTLSKDHQSVHKLNYCNKKYITTHIPNAGEGHN